jgi:phospholipid/cholesterol/gamma-HCH transport system substrate-binding protein
MRKELKIGICAVVLLGAFWWGFSFLSGLDVLGRNKEYTIHYEDVNGLQGDAAVVINGVKVGQVSNIALNKEKGGVDVSVSISSEYDIPTDSRAVLFSAGLMGGKSIKIQLGESDEYLQNGEAIEAEVQSDMFDTLTNELGEIKERVVVLIDNVNQTISGVDSLIDNNSQNVTLAIANLNKVLEDLEKSKIIDNIDGFCATLNQNGEKLDSIITDVGSVAHSISEQNLGEKLNAAIAQVSNVLTQINEGKGTLGNLVNNEKLYKELAQASQNLSLLLADIKENPKRYINVTVFGGKSYDEKQADKAARQADKEKKKAEKAK